MSGRLDSKFRPPMTRVTLSRPSPFNSKELLTVSKPGSVPFVDEEFDSGDNSAGIVWLRQTQTTIKTTATTAMTAMVSQIFLRLLPLLCSSKKANVGFSSDLAELRLFGIFRIAAIRLVVAVT